MEMAYEVRGTGRLRNLICIDRSVEVGSGSRLLCGLKKLPAERLCTFEFCASAPNNSPQFITLHKNS